MNVLARARCACAISASSALTRPVADDLFAADDQPVDAMGARTRCPPRDRPRPQARGRRCATAKSAHLPTSQRADVVAPEHRGAAAVPSRIASWPSARCRRRDRAPRASPASPRGTGRRARSTPSRRRPGHPDSGVEHVPHGRHAAPSRSSTGAVGDAGAARRELGDVGLRGGRSGRTRRRRPTSRAGRGTRRPAAVELDAVGLLLSVSARWVEGQPEPAASAADSSISRPVTENGEHGATARWTRAPGPGSCRSAARRSVSASTASSSSTSSSGGRPPSDSPRSIEPREATIRMPSSRAACTSASISPSRPFGNT